MDGKPSSSVCTQFQKKKKKRVDLKTDRTLGLLVVIGRFTYFLHQK